MHQTHGGRNPVGLRCQRALLPPQKEVEKAHEVEEMAMVALVVEVAMAVMEKVLLVVGEA